MTYLYQINLEHIHFSHQVCSLRLESTAALNVNNNETFLIDVVHVVCLFAHKMHLQGQMLL